MIIKEFKFYEEQNEDRDNVTLTAYIINEKGDLHGLGKRPAVLICPGGAYLNCADTEAEPVALKFNAMGYHAFILRYSRYGKAAMQIFTEPEKPLPLKTHGQHPTPVREIGRAMLVIREHAEEWEVDPEQIALCGFSAGAHNVAMYGTYWHTPLLTDYYHVEESVLRPAAMILCYTVSDYLFQTDVENIEDTATKAMIDAMKIAFFGTTTPTREFLKEVSPCFHVTEKTPPTFLWATSEDNVADVRHSLRMAHALADQKVPFELHIFEEGDHGLSIGTRASAIVERQVNPDVAKWVDLSEAWLAKRLKLQLKEE